VIIIYYIKGNTIKKQDIDRIVFGGNQKQAHTIKKALHPKIQELIVAMEPIDYNLSDVEVTKTCTAYCYQIRSTA
jgi:hypothetical protein